MKMAVLLANRGFFPSSVIEEARRDMTEALRKAGHEALMIPADKTRYGAVETTEEGMIFHDFLEAHHGEYDGFLIVLPNFGDENGIKAAIRDVNVPILLVTYPDEIGKMDFEHRRDSFCGKLGLGSVLKQMGKKVTSFMPFTAHPLSETFQEQLRSFAAVCRIVKKMKYLRIGAIGARTTAFKSVRYDEIALEKHGVDLETLDLSYVLARFDAQKGDDPDTVRWLDKLIAASDFGCMPKGKETLLARFGAVLEKIIKEMRLDAIAVRCWNELQEAVGFAPCALLGILNSEGIPAACELDVTNALSMTGLNQASCLPAGCLDWNNNFGDDLSKCILFHCGPLAPELMCEKGVMQEHLMFRKSFGPDKGWGLNVGHIKPGKYTFSSMRNEGGQVQYYLGLGEITDDIVEEAYFGTPGVFTAENLQLKLQRIFEGGFRHHCTITPGDWTQAIDEAYGKYLGYTRVDIDK